MRPSVSDISVYVSDLGTLVNDNVTSLVANSHRANATASNAPTICAAMKAATPAGAMPA
jgi:hypothetical protein